MENRFPLKANFLFLFQTQKAFVATKKKFNNKKKMIEVKKLFIDR